MKTNFLTTTKQFVNKSLLKTKKYSPEILLVAGVVGVVGSVVLACKATIKAQDILEEAAETKKAIEECKNNVDLVNSGSYTEEDAKKDEIRNVVQTSLHLAKAYAPAVILGGLSLTGIVASNNILRKRNVALAAAYATIDKSFKEYRNRVLNRFGETVEKEIRYNIKAKEIEETTIDKKGKETVIKKTVMTTDSGDVVSDYARFFDKWTVDEKGNKIINHAWTNDPEMNLAFLKAQQAYANDMLNSRRYLYLNEVYELLGFPKTKAGQVVGWMLTEDKSTGDNFVDFGIYKASDNFNDFIYGHDPILLDFNVDGNIWALM